MNQSHALLLTLACEVPLVLALASLHRARLPAARASVHMQTSITGPCTPAADGRGWLAPLPVPLAVLLASIAASCLTHPLAWHAASVLATDEYRRGVWLIETLVVLAEALLYSLLLRPGWRQALLWSVAANGASFALGQLPL